MTMNLSEFNAFCSEIFKQREVVNGIKKHLEDESGKLEALKAKAILILEENQLSNFKGADGTIFVTNKFSVSMPKDPDGKKALFDYLKAKEIFDAMITIHSASLNAWYDAELAAAVESGNVDFKVPGIGEPKHYKTLGIRGA